MSTETKPKRFRIAFSFAGEKRGFVQEVAELLSGCLGKDIGKDSDRARILYDKFHEAEFGRYDLGLYLPPLYRNESDLVVAVFSTDYDTGRWTGWEWMAIHAQLTREEGSKVLLSRYDLANPRGLFENAGFIELDDKTPHQFAKLILERLATNEGKPLDHYTKQYAQQLTPPLPPFVIPHSSFSIPHNLPALQPFFGRDEELGQIAVALEPESRTWGALIDGPGGMGKTSLAVRAALEVKPEVFDRIVFISLKPRELDDTGVRDLSGFILSGLTELLGEMARLLGLDDILKESDDKRPRLLLEALRGKRALLILDNLESLTVKERDTVFTFVNRLPTGCKAILTSRGRIGSGAAELILGKLSEEAALQTLAELATHNRELVKTNEAERLVLYRETGGAPLLLRWTAGQIGRGHCLTFTDAIAFLRSCPPGNNALEFVFGDLVADFSPAETQALCALTYFTQPASVEHIAAIAGVVDRNQSGTAAGPTGARTLLSALDSGSAGPVPALTEAEIDRALRSLVNRSLVIPSTELQTFKLVPLVADFLRSSKPEVIAATGSRLEQRAYALILENGYRNHDCFPVLDAAWPSVVPALPLFLAGPNERLQKVCHALDWFLNFTGRWDEWFALSQQAEIRAVEKGDHDNAGWRAYQAGFIQYLRSQAEAVLVCAERAAEHWQQAFPPGRPGQAGIRERAAALRLRGIGHELQQNYRVAITFYREVVELHRSLETESGKMAEALNDLAEAERYSGDLDAAELDYQEALRIARVVSDSTGVAIYSGNLAALALELGNWQMAEFLSREALALSETVGRKELIAKDCHRLAEALARQWRGAEAVLYARRAVEIFNDLGSSNLAGAQETLEKCEAEAMTKPE